jgi:hypothetical protein
LSSNCEEKTHYLHSCRSHCKQSQYLRLAAATRSTRLSFTVIARALWVRLWVQREKEPKTQHFQCIVADRSSASASISPEATGQTTAAQCQQAGQRRSKRRKRRCPCD